MKIIHVSENKVARYEMERDNPQIVPEAVLHCFDDPDPALAFALVQGYDVLLTEIDLWSVQLGGILLARAITRLNPRVSIIFRHRLRRERGRPRAVRASC